MIYNIILKNKSSVGYAYLDEPFQYTHITSKNEKINIIINEPNIHYRISKSFVNGRSETSIINATVVQSNGYNIFSNIDINVNAVDYNQLKETLQHECEHVLENCLEYINKNEKGIVKSEQIPLYNLALNNIKNENKYINTFSHVVYHVSKSEESANVSQLYSFMNNKIKEKQSNGEKIDVYELYKEYFTMIYYTNLLTLKNIVSKWDITSQPYNELVNFIKSNGFNLGNLQNYCVKNINNTINTFKKKCSKVLTKIINDNGLTQEHKERFNLPENLNNLISKKMTDVLSK
jgi:hypothetical protein